MAQPTSIAAGSTLLFTTTLSGYPATLYNLSFSLNLNGTSVANIAGTASGSDFVVTSPAATTALWTPGRYNFANIVTAISDAAVTCVNSGQLSVTPNFAATTPPTASQEQLAALDAVILSLCGKKFSSVSDNGHSHTLADLAGLLKQRDILQARVDAELRAMGLSTRGGAQTIVTRFTP